VSAQTNKQTKKHNVPFWRGFQSYLSTYLSHTHSRSHSHSRTLTYRDASVEDEPILHHGLVVSAPFIQFPGLEVMGGIFAINVSTTIPTGNFSFQLDWDQVGSQSKNHSTDGGNARKLWQIKAPELSCAGASAEKGTGGVPPGPLGEFIRTAPLGRPGRYAVITTAGEYVVILVPNSRGGDSVTKTCFQPCSEKQVSANASMLGLVNSVDIATVDPSQLVDDAQCGDCGGAVVAIGCSNDGNGGSVHLHSVIADFSAEGGHPNRAPQVKVTRWARSITRANISQSLRGEASVQSKSMLRVGATVNLSPREGGTSMISEIEVTVGAILASGDSRGDNDNLNIFFVFVRLMDFWDGDVPMDTRTFPGAPAGQLADIRVCSVFLPWDDMWGKDTDAISLSVSNAPLGNLAIGAVTTPTSSSAFVIHREPCPTGMFAVRSSAFDHGWTDGWRPGNLNATMTTKRVSRRGRGGGDGYGDGQTDSVDDAEQCDASNLIGVAASDLDIYDHDTIRCEPCRPYHFCLCGAAFSCLSGRAITNFSS
jgi:hypothetical protein